MCMAARLRAGFRLGGSVTWMRILVVSSSPGFVHCRMVSCGGRVVGRRPPRATLILCTNVVRLTPVSREVKTVAIKARVTAQQLAELERLADERFEGNLSAALRAALSDASLLDAARSSYRQLVMAHGFRFPEPDGAPTALETILSSGWVRPTRIIDEDDL